MLATKSTERSARFDRVDFRWAYPRKGSAPYQFLIYDHNYTIKVHSYRFISLFSFSIVILGICVLAFHIDVMASSIAHLKAFELLQAGYLDPRLLKHRFIPVIAGIFILLVVFEAYIKKLYNSIVKATSERMSS